MDNLKPFVSFLVTFLPFVLLFGFFVGFDSIVLKSILGVFIFFAVVEFYFWFKDKK